MPDVANFEGKVFVLVAGRWRAPDAGGAHGRAGAACRGGRARGLRLRDASTPLRRRAGEVSYVLALVVIVIFEFVGLLVLTGTVASSYGLFCVQVTLAALFLQTR